jgi:hypothetical protein
MSNELELRAIPREWYYHEIEMVKKMITEITSLRTERDTMRADLEHYQLAVDTAQDYIYLLETCGKGWEPERVERVVLNWRNARAALTKDEPSELAKQSERTTSEERI